MCRFLLRRRSAIAVLAVFLFLGWNTASICKGAEVEKPREPRSLVISGEPFCNFYTLSPDGKILVTQRMVGGRKVGNGRIGGTWQIQAWDTEKGRRLWSQPADFFPYSSMAFSPDGKLLACPVQFMVSDRDVSILLGDPKTGKVVRKLRKPKEAFEAGTGMYYNPQASSMTDTSVHFSPDGNLLSIVGDPDQVRTWDVSTGKFLGTVSGKQEMLRISRFLPDNRRLVAFGSSAKIERESGGYSMSGGECHDFFLHVWDVKALREEVKFKMKDLPYISLAINREAFSPDKRLFAYFAVKNSPDKKSKVDFLLLVCDTMTGKVKHSFPVDYSNLIFFSDDQKTLFKVGYQNYHLEVDAIDIEAGKIRRVLDKTLSDKKGTVFEPVNISPDRKLLAVGIADHVIKLYDTKTWKERASLQGPKDRFVIYSHTFSMPLVHQGPNDRGFALQFSQDGSHLVSVGAFGTSRPKEGLVGVTKATVWDLKSYLEEGTAEKAEKK